MTDSRVDPDRTRLYRVGALSAFAFVIGYVAIFALYASVGAPPNGGATFLTYAAGKTDAWWGILGISVLTDFLLIPIALAIREALKGADRTTVSLGIAFVLAFVVLDLAVTWPNYAALIHLTEETATAATPTQAAAFVAAAEYPSAVVHSTLEAVYAIATLSIGILLLGVAMRSSAFGRAAAYLGIVTGVLGIVAVAGPYLIDALGATIILVSLLTTVWVLVVGYRLYRLGWR